MSRKAWNNVLIFATLTMILLFNSTHKLWMENSDNGQPIPLLPPQSTVLTIQFGAYTLERIGQGWRVRPALDTSEQAMAAVVQAWQNATVMPLDDDQSAPEVNGSDALVIVVWLAGEAEGRVYKMYQLQGNLLEYQGRWWQLQSSNNQSLVITGVL